MPLSDAIRWDRRYREDPSGGRVQPRSILLQNLDLLPHSGAAIDLAMGLGANARVLVERGLTVVGIDISLEAARRARRKTPQLRAVCADLTYFRLPPRHFDVILNLYYLQRELCTALKTIIRPGGIVIVETLMLDMLKIKPELNPDYLLRTGELRELFSGWEILKYSEGWAPSESSKDRAVASLVGRFPA
jgi:tellurite methyltransferase